MITPDIEYDCDPDDPEDAIYIQLGAPDPAIDLDCPQCETVTQFVPFYTNEYRM